MPQPERRASVLEMRPDTRHPTPDTRIILTEEVTNECLTPAAGSRFVHDFKTRLGKMHPPSISHYQTRTATFPAHSNLLYMLTTSHYLHTSFLYFSLLFNSLLHVCFNSPLLQRYTLAPHSGMVCPLLSDSCLTITISSYSHSIASVGILLQIF